MMVEHEEAPLLSLRQLEVAFPLGKKYFGKSKMLHAVNNLSLDVTRGEFISIVGESGCGKSTLVKTLLGLLPPSAGSICLNGRELDTYTPRERAHLVQPVFQDPYSSLNPRKSAAENIALPLILSKRLTHAEVMERVRRIMGMVGLPRRYEHAYPTQMSGGQRQRVAIARALITRPELLVCDEPTSALDVSVQAQILNLLKDLSGELNLTCIFISHDLGVVSHLSQRVGVMYLGRFVEIGDCEVIFSQPRHPYTQLLINSILPPDPSYRLPKVQWDSGGPDPINPPAGCLFQPRCPYAREACAAARPELVPFAGIRVACRAYEPGADWHPLPGQH